MSAPQDRAKFVDVGETMSIPDMSRQPETVKYAVGQRVLHKDSTSTVYKICHLEGDRASVFFVQGDMTFIRTDIPLIDLTPYHDTLHDTLRDPVEMRLSALEEEVKSLRQQYEDLIARLGHNPLRQ